jgi:hypothetical protein
MMFWRMSRDAACRHPSSAPLLLVLASMPFAACSPSASTAPAKATGPATTSAVPASAGVFYIAAEGGQAGSVAVVDWAGRTASSISLPFPVTNAAASADGSEFLVTRSSGGKKIREVDDLTGHQLANLDLSSGWLWSASGNTLCVLTNPEPQSATDVNALSVVRPDGKHDLGRLPPLSNGEAGAILDVVTCNAEIGIVAITEDYLPSGGSAFITYRTRVLRLSDLSAATDASGDSLVMKGRVLVAPDGKTYATGIPSAGSRLGSFSGGTVSTAHLAGIPLAFSADSTRLLVGENPSESTGNPGRLRIYDVQSGKLVWTTAGTASTYRASPEGATFVVSVGPPFPGAKVAQGIFLVDHEGQATRVGTRGILL